MARHLALAHQGSAGTALIEFALALPIIVGLLFGVIDFGIIMQSQVVVQHAADEAVRFAITGEGYEGGSRDADVAAAAREAASALGMVELAASDQPGSFRVTVSSSSAASCPGGASGAGGPEDFVCVEVDYNCPSATGLLTWFLPKPMPYVPLHAQALAPNERFKKPD
jgi:Flp pilus assembly protein TadG